MKLSDIWIYNFRSIDEVHVPCDQLEDGSATFGLIGLNEAGKSSILKAVALFNSKAPLTAKDFHDRDSDLSVDLVYEVDKAELSQIHAHIRSKFPESEFVPEKYPSSVVCFATYFKAPGVAPAWMIGFDPSEGETDWFPVDSFPEGFIPKPIFWTASDKYLISQPISLSQFAPNPLEVSVPLRNCFLLAGIADIPRAIAGLQQDSTENEFLVRKLGKSVTDHIRAVWPNHPIEITFLINGDFINFHVKDLGADRPKTADQRSDGFRQFISFLLTVSAQNKNQELSRAILLLDEPETHLHPLAQEHLLKELVRLTSNDRENVVIFATHSNYMIDKKDLSRNFRVFKEGGKTQVKGLDKKVATYASVTYEVFDIASSDYHNELYAKLHESYQDQDASDSKRALLKNFDEAVLHKRIGLPQDRPWKKTVNQVTLPTFVRNCIHHPDNGDTFNDEDLRASIGFLRKVSP